MYFEPCNVEKIKRRKARSNLKELLLKIADSGEACVEIKDYEHASSKICYESIWRAIKRYRMSHLEVVRDKGNIYIINTLLVKDEK